MVKAKLKTATQDNWVEIAMQIDNGSEVNCIRKQDLKQIDPKAEITRTKTTLRTYGNSQIHPLGTVQLVVCINNVQKQAEFIVIEETSTSLLSGQLSEDLHLITVNSELLINQVSAPQPLTKEHVIEAYHDVFEGLGHIGTYVTENAQPTHDAPRTVPVALRTELKKRLKEMQAEGMIKKVEQRTDWVNSAVYVKIPHKKLRICLDPRELNKFVKVPKYRMPTLEDITPQLSKARILSVCDAKDGFLQHLHVVKTHPVELVDTDGNTY